MFSLFNKHGFMAAERARRRSCRQFYACRDRGSRHALPRLSSRRFCLPPRRRLHKERASDVIYEALFAAYSRARAVSAPAQKSCVRRRYMSNQLVARSACVYSGKQRARCRKSMRPLRYVQACATKRQYRCPERFTVQFKCSARSSKRRQAKGIPSPRRFPQR